MARIHAASLPAIAGAALALAACGELPQDGPKPFVSPAEQRSMWQPAHAMRTAVQDEYSPTHPSVTVAAAGAAFRSSSPKATCEAALPMRREAC